jgi:hypothetical protein
MHCRKKKLTMVDMKLKQVMEKLNTDTVIKNN